ncbi:hypothetical protein RJ640_017860 [Escallonia rubra]|uniref:F-box associated beta-propeller type 3 domain-containing protein n=1 Tax=Escallonia rubra TaxID=112253 RepID=A0AA88UUQ7_9ASTE|nr:hypothetical protein RJ640_017860 [Escallonia rubra]
MVRKSKPNPHKEKEKKPDPKATGSVPKPPVVKPETPAKATGSSMPEPVAKPETTTNEGEKAKEMVEKSEILVSFSDANGDNHYFWSKSLEGGGPFSKLLSLPGCNNGHGNSCGCSVSESVYGLVLFCNGKNVYLVNPTCKSFVTLPKSMALQRYCDLELNLYFVYSSYSLGFDPVANEYKVLHVHGVCKKLDPSDPNSDPYKLLAAECEILTIKVNSAESETSSPESLSWKTISNSRIYHYLFGSEGVCIDSSMHWLALGKQAVVEAVVAFELECEKFYLIKLPKGIPPVSSLTQIGGRLALVCGPNLTAGTELWVLEDYCKLRWVKKFVYVEQNKMGTKPIGVGTVKSGLLTPTATPNVYEVISVYQKVIEKDGSASTKDQKDQSVRVMRFTGLPTMNFTMTNHVENSVLCRRWRVQIGGIDVHLGA